MKKIIAAIMLSAFTAFGVDVIPNPVGVSTVGDPTNWFFGIYSSNYYGNGALLTGIVASEATAAQRATNAPDGNRIASLIQATNAASAATNGLPNGAFTVNPLTSVPFSATNQATLTNDAVWFDRASDRVALTNAYLRLIAVGVTNQFLPTNSLPALTNGHIVLADIPKQTNSTFIVTNGNEGNGKMVYSTNAAPGYFWADSPAAGGGITHADWTNDYAGNIPFSTNQMTRTNDSFWFLRQDQRNALTNSFLVDSIIGTTALIDGNNAAGVELAITNANKSSWSGFTAQSDNGSFVTNYFGMFINNSQFVPGLTYVGTTNDAVLEMAAGNFIVDMIGNNAHWFFITRGATNGAQTTNWDLTASGLNFITQPKFNGANLITGIAVTDTNGVARTNDGRAITHTSPANVFAAAFFTNNGTASIPTNTAAFKPVGQPLGGFGATYTTIGQRGVLTVNIVLTNTATVILSNTTTKFAIIAGAASGVGTNRQTLYMFTNPGDSVVLTNLTAGVQTLLTNYWQGW